MVKPWDHAASVFEVLTMTTWRAMEKGIQFERLQIVIRSVPPKTMGGFSMALHVSVVSSFLDANAA